MNPVLDRRALLRATGATVTAGAVGAVGAVGAIAAGSLGSAVAAPVFAHGVASGDPLPDAVLLWTRVTPTPDALPGSGAGPRVDVL